MEWNNGMDYGMDNQNEKMLFCRLASPALPGISYLLGSKSAKMGGHSYVLCWYYS